LLLNDLGLDGAWLDAVDTTPAVAGMMP
jgi:hypothetical protein